MYRLHRDALTLVAAYPTVFSSTTRHKDGTATMRLKSHYSANLLQSIINYLHSRGVHVIHFQLAHVPNTIKLSTRYTMVAESFREQLSKRTEFLPSKLSFGDPVSTEAASELSGYNIQYVRLLARDSKIASEKIGGIYYVSQQSLVDYLMSKVRQEILAEFGQQVEPLLRRYLDQPLVNLPLQLRTRKEILDDFQKWINHQLADDWKEASIRRGTYTPDDAR